MNKTIIKVELSQDESSIIFTTDESEEIAYYAFGDCCSISWFAHITGIKNLLNEKVVDVDTKNFSEAEVEERSSDGRYDVLEVYAYSIKTSKGICDIEFRNDSNGYYGGSAELSSREEGKKYKTILEDI